MLVECIATPFLANIDNLQLQRAIADLSGAKFVIRHVAMSFVVYPDSLVLPVLGIESIEVVEKVDLPGFIGRLLFAL